MATMGDDALFVDTNVLVYANVAEAPLHGVALHAITQAQGNGRDLWISRQVLREYLATMTRPQTFGALSRKLVLEQVRSFGGRFKVADESWRVTEHLLQLLTVHGIGGKRVHDANIVATMMACEIPTLLTHNVADFECFGKQIALESIG